MTWLYVVVGIVVLNALLLGVLWLIGGRGR